MPQFAISESEGEVPEIKLEVERFAAPGEYRSASRLFDDGSVIDRAQQYERAWYRELMRSYGIDPLKAQVLMLLRTSPLLKEKIDGKPRE